MKLTETTLEHGILYNGKILRLERDKVLLENGRTAYREVVRHNGGACVIALTDDNQAVMVKQYRYPYKEVLPEIPAGKLESGEDPLECAVRELQEETGYSATNIIPLGQIYPTPGYSDEVIYIYLARGLELTKASPDEDEFLDVETIDFDVVLRMIYDNEIKDAKTIIGVLKAKAIMEADN